MNIKMNQRDFDNAIKRMTRLEKKDTLKKLEKVMESFSREFIREWKKAQPSHFSTSTQDEQMTLKTSLINNNSMLITTAFYDTPKGSNKVPYLRFQDGGTIYIEAGLYSESAFKKIEHKITKKLEKELRGIFK